MSCHTLSRDARLRRKSDVKDTGATTQGTCIAFNANGDYLTVETILFLDGSTLEFQGIERAGGVPSARTIAGGSGRYLGAIGTMTAARPADLLLWTKAIEIAAPSDR
ncbi:MAG: hypothetical protein K0S99_3551 [Thermomicrobiales bacterium]|nr:hypothetical protein [Thermomicrobiales bacterium]